MIVATKISHNVDDAVGGLLCVESSIPLGNGVIPNIIEDIRLLEIEYSSEP